MGRRRGIRLAVEPRPTGWGRDEQARLPGPYRRIRLTEMMKVDMPSRDGGECGPAIGRRRLPYGWDFSTLAGGEDSRHSD